MNPDCTISADNDIKLTPPTLDIANVIFRTIDKHRDSLRTWLPFIDFTKSEKDSEAFLRSIPESGEIVYVIYFQDQFAGLIGLKNPDNANHKVEIGYWISPEFEGKGIVTNSCRRLIEHAFENLEMNRILIQVATGNAKSRRIPERLGFKEEGIERDGELLSSGFTDIVRYGLLKREYNGSY